MDRDVRSLTSGVCPRCGMQLVLSVPEPAEYAVTLTHRPSVLLPNMEAVLSIRVREPDANLPVKRFEIVHEKLMHVLLVSENLQMFQHLHPRLLDDGSFALPLRLPESGMYRLLFDFYPSGGTPQLAVKTLFVSGVVPERTVLVPSAGSYRAENLAASLRTEPAAPIAGIGCKLFFTLDPAEGVEKYLGAWGHMLIASADLIDLLHVHPFLADPQGVIQFDVLFPRPGLYRLWTQFQRAGVINTVVFTLSVADL